MFALHLNSWLLGSTIEVQSIFSPITYNASPIPPHKISYHKHGDNTVYTEHHDHEHGGDNADNVADFEPN